MSRAQLNYSLRRNKTATRGSGATNQLRDAAAEKLKGTEAGLKPHQPMSYATNVAVITGVGPGTGPGPSSCGVGPGAAGDGPGASSFGVGPGTGPGAAGDGWCGDSVG